MEDIKLIEYLNYLIYLLTFIIGSIVGLLWSYKNHSQPYTSNGLDSIALVFSFIGWIFVFLGAAFWIRFTISFILLAIGFFFVGFVFNERPGYGRKETAIGIIAGIIIYGILKYVFMV